MSTSTLRLYEITDSFLQTLEALAEMEDLPQEAIADTLEGLAGTFQDKALNVAAYIRTLEAEAVAIEEAYKRMEQRQRSLRHHADRLRQYLKQQMERTGLTKIKNCQLLMRVQANPPSVVIDSENQIPNAFREIITTTKLLKAEIGKALKAGESIPGAHLEQSTRLVIS